MEGEIGTSFNSPPLAPKLSGMITLIATANFHDAMDRYDDWQHIREINKNAGYNVSKTFAKAVPAKDRNSILIRLILKYKIPFEPDIGYFLIHNEDGYCDSINRLYLFIYADKLLCDDNSYSTWAQYVPSSLYGEIFRTCNVEKILTLYSKGCFREKKFIEELCEKNSEMRIVRDNLNMTTLLYLEIMKIHPLYEQCSPGWQYQYHIAMCYALIHCAEKYENIVAAKYFAKLRSDAIEKFNSTYVKKWEWLTLPTCRLE